MKQVLVEQRRPPAAARCRHKRCIKPAYKRIVASDGSPKSSEGAQQNRCRRPRIHAYRND